MRKFKLLISIVVLGGIPILLGLYLKKDVTNGDWLQFWGTYLGIITSVTVATILFTSENKANLVTEQNNRVTNLYLIDLRDISSETSIFDFKSRYWEQLETSEYVSKEDVVNIRKYFFEVDGDEITMKSLLKLNTIIKGMPSEKNEQFECLVEDIYLALHNVLQSVSDINLYIPTEEYGLVKKVAEEKKQAGIKLSDHELIFLINLKNRTTDLQKKLIALRESFDALSNELKKEFDKYNTWTEL